MGRYTDAEREWQEREGRFPRCGHDYTAANIHRHRSSSGYISELCLTCFRAKRRRDSSAQRLHFKRPEPEPAPAPRIEPKRKRNGSGSGVIAGPRYYGGRLLW